MAASIQSLGAPSSFLAANSINSKEFYGRKVSFLVVRAENRANYGSMAVRCKTGNLVTQAVASPAASTASSKTGSSKKKRRKDHGEDQERKHVKKEQETNQVQQVRSPWTLRKMSQRQK